MPKSDHYVNREISWLSFNARVLQEAADPKVPLIERLKFLGIFSSNLDEFFRVRVATLKRIVTAGVKSKALFGDSPKKILNQIHEIVLKQRVQFDKIFNDLNDELEKEHIYIINEFELNPKQRVFVEDYFRMDVRPRLVPIMLNSVPEFPYLKNQIIYLAIHLSKTDNPKKVKYALIEVPADVLPRFIALPGVGNKKYIIMLDDVIRFGLKDIFAIFKYDKIDAYTIKLTRDAEINIKDDITKSAFEKISKSIKQRSTGQPVRFVYDRKMPADILNFVLEKNGLQNFDNVIIGGRYHNAKDFMKFPNVGKPSLEYPRITPLSHPEFSKYGSMFNAISEKDILLHNPYQSFSYVIDLLREAAIDPKVVSIKMTLYRVAKYSNVVNALVNAKKNGKKLSVLLELQARFDEEANIYWTKKLEEEGVHIIDTVPGLKVHAKICLITRKEGKKTVHYAIIGTGNYNEATAKLYSDQALFTANKKITNEVSKVFDFLENNYKTFNYKHLLVSPFNMRKRFYALIKEEIKNVRAGKKAYICIKLNSLVDRSMIDKLYEASQAGVKIRLIIRGTCSLVPGIKALSENIEVVSIVDKFLEHSRLFIFCNGGEEKHFLTSADWMIRNLDNRVEVGTPIYDARIQREIKDFFEIQWRDATKARLIDKEQSNAFRKNGHTGKFRAQQDFYDYLKKNYKISVA